MTAVPGIERIAALPMDAATRASATPAVVAPDTPAVPPAANPESVQKFRDLMQQTQLTHSAQASSRHPSALSNVVAGQDQAMNEMAQKVKDFEQKADTMDQRQFTAEVVRMQFEMAETMTRIELGVSFAQGGKGAVQNLMKNQ